VNSPHKQGLIKLPGFVREPTPCLQGVRFYRKTVNNVLTRHGINGYPRKHKRWKFFRAEKPDELWQIDFKDPFTVYDKKYWFLVCIDEHSRFLVIAEQFDHKPKTKEVTALLEKQKALPKAILSDHGPQFKEKWRRWCRQRSI
jgi:transposase InsO family protein